MLVSRKRRGLSVLSVRDGSVNAHGLCSARIANGWFRPSVRNVPPMSVLMSIVMSKTARVISSIETARAADGLVRVSRLRLVGILEAFVTLSGVAVRGVVLLTVLIVRHI